MLEQNPLADEADLQGGICWPCVRCNKCGRMTDKFKCPVCQHQLDPGDTLCPKCGAPVLPTPGQTAGGTLAQPTAPPPPSAVGHHSPSGF